MQKKKSYKNNKSWERNQKITDAVNAGASYPAIGKMFDLHESTIVQIYRAHMASVDRRRKIEEARKIEKASRDFKTQIVQA